MIVNTFSILNFTNPSHGGSGTVRRMRDFALEADFPTSEFCRLRPPVKSNLFGFCFWVLYNQGLRLKEQLFQSARGSQEQMNWSTANGAFDLLAGGVHCSRH